MKVLSVVSQKGGVGKTTLALHWAVEAHRQHSGPVAILDLDMQASAVRWYQRREAEHTLVLQADASRAKEAVAACRGVGMSWVFLDTMPRANSAMAIRLADLCVISCGPSVLDIEALASTVAVAALHGSPCVLVINQGRHSSGINQKVRKVLQQYGLPVCPIPVMHRAVLVDALIEEGVAVELQPHSKATREIAATWQWLLTQL